MVRVAPVRAVGVVGDDFRQTDLDLLAPLGDGTFADHTKQTRSAA